MKKLLLSTLLLPAAMSAATFVGDRADFRDETIYFTMTTRFYDGDPSNNVYCWDGKLNVNDPEWRGDFKGLIEKLDYIKALGFTAVWITPVVENCSGLDYHGYHAFNFSKVDPRYLSQDCAFQDVIDAAHARGMKIILDIVLNHNGNFGEENLCPLFVKDYSQNLSNVDKSLKLHPKSPLSANYFSLPGGQQHSQRLAQMKNSDGQNHDVHNYWHHVANEWNWDDYSRWYGQIAGDCVDLNTENPAVSQYLVDCYGKFIEMGVDGFRIDTSGHIARLTFNNAFIPQFQALAEKYKAKRNGGDFFMFGEVCARERNVVYRNHENCSPFFYTWKESEDYPWDYDASSWDSQVIMEGSKGDHINTKSVDQQGKDHGGEANMPTSNNAFLSGNDYHAPDRSRYSGLSVIDFPMHWNFGTAREAYGVKYGDKYYNDATYNVVYVDSHDYAPDGAPESQRFSKSQDTWAENLDLMFTFRGIPCIYYGSEIEFKKGCIIDKGALIALAESGRAYFGGYITGDIKVNDFADYTNATGNLAATLSHPLAMHIQRLNLIRAAVPALRKGQYSTEGCSGDFAFKRRYTDDKTDSYCLVTISGNATFTGILNGTYTDVITGDTKTVTDGKLSATCSGKGNMRVYVLSTPLTPAPGRIGIDGKYLYTTSSVVTPRKGYDGNEEALDYVTKRDDEAPTIEEPDEPVELTMAENEQAVFFKDTNSWGGTIKVYAWSGNNKYAGAWPGTPATYLGNKTWKWTYTGPQVIANGSGLIFNNGSKQTADLAWTNGGVYDGNGTLLEVIGNGLPPEIDEPTPDPGKEHEWSIYFINQDNWDKVYAYIYSNTGNPCHEITGSWPGKQMTPGDDGLYSIKITTAERLDECYIIFNNTSGKQTADLVAIRDRGIYSPKGDTGESGVAAISADSQAVTYYNLQGHRIAVPVPGQPTIAVTPAGSRIIIR